MAGLGIGPTQFYDCGEFFLANRLDSFNDFHTTGFRDTDSHRLVAKQHLYLFYVYHQRPFFLLWFLLMVSSSWEVEYFVWSRRAAISSK